MRYRGGPEDHSSLGGCCGSSLIAQSRAPRTVVSTLEKLKSGPATPKIPSRTEPGRTRDRSHPDSQRNHPSQQPSTSTAEPLLPPLRNGRKFAIDSEREAYDRGTFQWVRAFSAVRRPVTFLLFQSHLTHLDHPPPFRRKRSSTAIRSKFRIRRKGDPSWCSRFAGRCQDAMKSEEVGNQCIAGLFPGQHPSAASFLLLLFSFPQDPGNGLPGEATKTQESRHGRGLPQPSQAPNAGPRRREEARQACCPTSIEGSVKRSLPIPRVHDPRAT